MRTVGEGNRVKVPRATHHTVVKRLWCTSCAKMADCRRIGRAAEYTLDCCGATRGLMSSEAIQERSERDDQQ
jgi:hypothetical protein